MKNLPMLLWIAGCGGASQLPVDGPSGPVSDTITMLYQSRVDGEIEPCG